MNFVEGTRFTKAKAKAQKSPYQNLMPPKAASLAVALGIIGPKLDCILNTTLQYPKNDGGKVFIDLLKGRLHEVIARVEVIPAESFTQKLRELWQAKDEQIAQLLGISYQRPELEAETKAASAPDTATKPEAAEPTPAPVAAQPTAEPETAVAAQPETEAQPAAEPESSEVKVAEAAASSAESK